MSFSHPIYPAYSTASWSNRASWRMTPPTICDPNLQRISGVCKKITILIVCTKTGYKLIDVINWCHQGITYSPIKRDLLTTLFRHIHFLLWNVHKQCNMPRCETIVILTSKTYACVITYRRNTLIRLGANYTKIVFTPSIYYSRLATSQCHVMLTC